MILYYFITKRVRQAIKTVMMSFFKLALIFLVSILYSSEFGGCNNKIKSGCSSVVVKFDNNNESNFYIIICCCKAL